MAGTQDKLSRVRKPRVHITYDVETDDAVVQKELPFVVGVMGDFSGDPDPDKPLASLSDRKFTQIDRDNFNTVLAGMAPNLNLEVENTLEGSGTFKANLKFKSMEDFEPGNIVKNVEPLNKLLETRNKLFELASKAGSSEQLENLLEEVLTNSEQLASLAGQLDKGKEG